MNTLAKALVAARARIPVAEARLLLGHVLQRPAAWLIAHDDDVLAATQEHAFNALVARRAAGEPIAYLLGQREFYGREFGVAPGVLIPRPETELLVEAALAQKLGAGGTACILDLGTGSGCIAITLALEWPQAAVTAIDASQAALEIARGNAAGLGATVRFIESDWFARLSGEVFDLIVSNPPYVAEGDPHLSEGDLRFEPPSALACGADGLSAIRQIVAAAPAHLRPGGALWLEHGYDQAAAVRALLQAAGFSEVASHTDLAGIERISGGCWVPTRP